MRAQRLRASLSSSQLIRGPARPTSRFRPRNYASTTTTNSPHATTVEDSVNHTEVAHFNALASSWWDPHGSSRLLHLMNPLRHDFIERCLSSSAQSSVTAPNDKLRYLDVGCGGGIFAESAARKPNTASVTAIDPTPEVVAVARRHQRTDPLLLEPDRLTYINTSIENHISESSPAGNDGLYDIVTLFEVVEHIRRPSPFLQSCLARVKPGGWLIGSTIARTQTSWFTTKFMAEEVMGIVPRGTHDWNQYLQPSELRSWAAAQEEVECGLNGGLGWKVMGVVYVPGVGWKEVDGSETWGNYFFGMQKSAGLG